MATIKLYKRASYYSRIIKDNNPILIATLNDINFNPNDNVNSALVVNIDKDLSELPNYLTVDDKTNWFIIGANRLRQGQYRFILKRNTILDHLSAINGAEAIIQKGYVSDENALIFNSEPINVNQIKRQEVLLDRNNLGWCVAYLAKNFKNDETDSSANKTIYQIDFKVPSDIPGMITIDTPITEVPLFKKYDGKTVAIFDESYKIHFWTYLAAADSIFHYIDLYCDRDGLNAGVRLDYEHEFGPGYYTIQELNDATKKMSVVMAYNLAQKVSTSDGSYTLGSVITHTEGLTGISRADYDEMLSWKGKTVKDSTGNIYQISFDRLEDRATYSDAISRSDLNKQGADCANAIMKGIKNLENFSVLDNHDEIIDSTLTADLSRSLSCYQLKVSFLDTDSNKFELDTTKIQDCADSAYNILAVPFYINAPVKITKTGSTYATKAKAINLVQSIATAIGSNCYDLQILPYTNLGIDTSQGFLDDSSIPASYKYEIVDTDDATKVLEKFYYLGQANFSFSLPFDISKLNLDSIDNVSNYYHVSKKKLANICSMTRLVSPNYNGQFEFNIAKNDYQIGSFNIDCALKPYNPYIHVAPDFKGLYGRDFNDSRGLICGGDFSLSMVSSAWVNYEINNKNYQNIFDRQIQNMDATYAIQRNQQTWGMISGVVQAMAMGGGLGSLGAGLKWSNKASIGAGIAGGLVAGISSLGAGLADLQACQDLYNENKDYIKDNFTMTLDNIKALPYSLSKVSSLTPNSKIVPFLELYLCTETEMEKVAHMLKYSGYSLGITDQLNETYFNHYLQATIIEFSDNSSLTQSEYVDINNELMKGLYINGLSE